MASERSELGAKHYRQVPLEQADSLQLLGVAVWYRFPRWKASDGYSPLSGIIASDERKRVPSKFYAVYDTPYWASTGVPSFYAEVE